MGRLAQETNAASKSQNYSYDLAGNLTKQTDYNGLVQSFDYDVMNRLVDAKSGTTVEKTFAYDPLGRMTQATNAQGTWSWNYDLLGRLASQNDPLNDNWTFSYDAAGNKLSQSKSDFQVQFAYGNENELLKVVDSNRNETDFGYDDAQREVEKDLPNRLTRTIQYDDGGRVTVLKDALNNRTGNIVWGEAYAYDSGSKIIGKVDQNGNITTYSYDDAGRLNQVQYPIGSGKKESDRASWGDWGLHLPGDRGGKQSTISSALQTQLGALYQQVSGSGWGSLNDSQNFWTETLTYDGSGNRVSQTTPWGTVASTYDSDNRLTKTGNESFTYDSNGNILTQSTLASTLSLTYDFENRMIVSRKNYNNTREDTGQYQATESDTYAYDPLGRRISRTDNLEDRSNNSQYVYEGLSHQLMQIPSTQSADSNYGADRDGGFDMHGDGRGWGQSNFLNRDQDTTNVVYGNGELLTVQGERHSVLSVYEQDLQGSVRYITDNQENGIERYDYDVFGKPLKDAPALIGYNGKVYDSFTRTYEYGYRDYIPELSRWSTQDPIQSGSNWYAYVNNDPVNSTDPTGLETYVGRTPVVGFSSSSGSSGATNTGWSVIGAYHTLTVITDKPITEPGAKVLATYEAGPDYSKDSTSNLGNLVQQKEWSTPDKVQANPGAYDLEKVPLPSSYPTQEAFDQAIAAKAEQYNSQTPSPYQAVPEWSSDPDARNSNSYTGSLIRSVGAYFKPDYWAPGFQLNVPGVMNPTPPADSAAQSKGCGS